jgi:pimeloyl-ACP methyl ester carboxylesterase
MKETRYIGTEIGSIAVHIQQRNDERLPIVFLHGLYFDYRLWNEQVAAIHDRTVILLDMPHHGASTSISKRDWTLVDCANMLLDILKELNIERVIAVGHSWGGRTIAQAALMKPEVFAAIGLCNIPFQKSPQSSKLLTTIQHTLLSFRTFYIKQAGKSLYGKNSLATRPELLQQLHEPMAKLKNREIKHADRTVRIQSRDASEDLKRLQVQVIAIAGEEDYVGIPPIANVRIVEGGHISPLEAPERVNEMMRELTELSEHDNRN